MKRNATVKNIMLLGSALHTGGAERVMAHLVRRLDPSRYRVTACHLMNRGTVGEELARDGYDVVGVKRERRPLLRYLSSRNLIRVIEERGIDLVHTHTHYALTDASLCRLMARPHLKLVHTFHFGNYPHIPRRYRWLEWSGSRAANRLIAVGVEQAKAIRATSGLAEDRLKVIANGAELGAGGVDAAWQARLRDAGVVVGTICTFIEQKGLPDLLRVAAALKQSGVAATFVVVGDGPLRPAIEEQCRAMNLSDSVLLAGHVPAAAAAMLPLFDVFLQPSRWEAMSMVVVEAMAAGKPVVVTDVGDNRHVVVDGLCGRVVPAQDVGAMAAALRELIESVDLRRRLGEAGRRRYACHYTVETMARAHEALYEEALHS